MNAPTSTVQSVTVGQVTPYTPDPALLATPYGKTGIQLPLTASFPFHRIYFGRISGAGVNYNEKLRIGLRYKGREVWSVSTQEGNLDLASILAASDSFGISTQQVVGPQYCVETVEIDSSSTAPDWNPRSLFNTAGLMVFNCRIRTSLTKDLLTRIYSAPLPVTQLADNVFLEVSHDNYGTTPDLNWAGRVYALGCHSSITP